MEFLMTQKAFDIPRIFPASTLVPRQQTPEASWDLKELAGRVVEMRRRGVSSVLTFTMSMIIQAQKRNEHVAWIHTTQSLFFPPDAHRRGVDFRALAIIDLPDERSAGRAATRLLSSGAFGLLVLDLGSQTAFERPLQNRLSRLAKQHGTALICLTEDPSAGVTTQSMGGFVSLWCTTDRISLDSGRFQCSFEALKDRQRSPGWRWEEVFDGPCGLR
jgi:recombination protein RecA